MKCRSCRGPAVIDVWRHNAAFCADCFVRHCREQVNRTIEHFKMLERGSRVLVAVSGGKDSLALWDMLLEAGYQADGLYLGLGIDGYSSGSAVKAKEFATSRGATLLVTDLPTDLGFDIPTGAAAAKRTPCSACGLSKRHLFNQAAMDGGYDVLATGHNLDDEAAVLFGNVLRWDLAYLARQMPVLPATPGFPAKVKPLVRISERESAAYCLLRGIDYVIEECPMSKGNKHLAYKDALNEIEARSPGSKSAFYNGFIERVTPLLEGVATAQQDTVGECSRCGSPTTGEVCAFCRLSERAVAAAGETR